MPLGDPYKYQYVKESLFHLVMCQAMVCSTFSTMHDLDSAYILNISFITSYIIKNVPMFKSLILDGQLVDRKSSCR